MAHATFDKPRRATATERQSKRRRGGWRTAKKRNKLGGQTRAGEKAAAKRHELAVKAETRRVVWARTSVCESCGDTEAQTANKFWKREHEAHEVRPRSLTRGEAPEIRFSPANTARLCGPCHPMFTHHLREFRPHDPALGMNGSFDVISRAGDVLRTVNR